MSSSFDELKFIPRASQYLAQSLTRGQLVLFLGAGVSRGFGLPGWLKLVNLMRVEVSLPEIVDVGSAEDLQLAADDILDKVDGKNEELINLLEKALYIDSKNLSSANVFENPLLISISALLMGSKRGHVTRVVTLNYDSMLEWVLSLFGFIVKTIHTLPELEGSEDVRIYHPHGFVPMKEHNLHAGGDIILGLYSANSRIGKEDDLWGRMVRHILNTGVCLFIGMSEHTLSDRAIAPLITDCGRTLKGRPVGLWILGNKISESKEREFDRVKVVPLIFEGFDEIPNFILSICQEASNFLKK